MKVELFPILFNAGIVSVILPISVFSYPRNSEEAAAT